MLCDSAATFFTAKISSFRAETVYNFEISNASPLSSNEKNTLFRKISYFNEPPLSLSISERSKNQSPPPPLNKRRQTNQLQLAELANFSINFGNGRSENTNGERLSKRSLSRRQRGNNQLFHFHSKYPERRNFPPLLGWNARRASVFRSFSRLARDASAYQPFDRDYFHDLSGLDRREATKNADNRCFAHEFSLCRWCKLCRRSLPRMKFTVTYGVCLFQSSATKCHRFCYLCSV